MFVDEVEIRVQSGGGGNGCVSFRREKFIPFGGPNGGNGGKGGDVWVVATRNKQSLLDFKFQPFYRADRGEHGMGKEMDGRSGEDLIIQVPPGTIVYDTEQGERIADLTEVDTPFLIAKGGRGGRGNKTFKSSVQRAPRFATPGKLGEARSLRLELQLLADVGLVGLPNAGKSSFLRSISRAQPKVADYPFTTLDPHLGVASHKGCQIVVADLPGLIEGASQGAGLGHKFLRHVARNRLLLHVVDCSPEVDAITHNIEVVEHELKEHDPELAERPLIYVFSKIDLLAPAERRHKAMVLKERGYEGFYVSNPTGEGFPVLLDELAERSVQWNPPPEEILPN